MNFTKGIFTILFLSLVPTFGFAIGASNAINEFQSCRWAALPVANELRDTSTKDNIDPGHTVFLSNGIEVLKRKPRLNEGDKLLIEVRKAGHTILKWPVLDYLGDTSDFGAWATPETNDTVLIASRESESVGIAVQSWQIYVVNLVRKTKQSIPTEDFGLSSFVQKLSAKCQLLTTRWETQKDKTGRVRNAFVAQVFDIMNDGRFKRGSASFIRFFSFKFEKQRLDGINKSSSPLSRNDPLNWLQAADKNGN
jgi:hypothetical protein